MRTAKYMGQDYKTNEDILWELKIKSDAKKIQNYRNKRIQYVQWINKYHTLLWNINHVGNKIKDNPSQDFSTVNGTGTGREA